MIRAKWRNAEPDPAPHFAIDGPPSGAAIGRQLTFDDLELPWATELTAAQSAVEEAEDHAREANGQIGCRTDPAIRQVRRLRRRVRRLERVVAAIAHRAGVLA